MTELLNAAQRERLLDDLVDGRCPDARGRFGPFGGRYVPETLIPAHERLEAGVQALAARPRLPGRAERPADELGRPSDGAHLRAAAVAALGRGAVAEARGPGAHRCAQDQQRPGPGAAGEAPGREAHRRRDRRRPARRGHRRGLRAPRPALHGVHGRGGHGAPGAERRAHAAAGRDRGAGHRRRPDAARGHRRGHARLGRRSGRHLLPPRLRGGPASLSLSGARTAGRHRPRGARAVPAAHGRAAGRGDRLRRRRLERHRPVPSVHRRSQRADPRHRGRRPRHRASGENAATLVYGRPGVLHGCYTHAAAG